MSRRRALDRSGQTLAHHIEGFDLRADVAELSPPSRRRFPSELGGVRNWDYRYCWLRDATFTLLALMHLGYYEEARAWRDWLVRAVAGSPHQIQIMYGVGGERWLPELIVPWLPGYENSSPVRIGNAAYAAAAARRLRRDRRCDRFRRARRAWTPTERGRALRPVVLDYLATAWRQPTKAFGRCAAGRQHFVHSKVMAWVAFDRAAHEVDAEAFNEPGRRWREIADEIHAEVCERGFDRELNSFVQAYGSKRLDASLLLIPLVGFLPASRSARSGNAASDRGEAADRSRIRSALRNRKFRRRPARGRRSFLGVQLLAGRQLHIARPLCGSSKAFRSFALALQ